MLGSKIKNTFTPDWIKGMCNTVTDSVLDSIKDQDTPDFKWSEEDFYDLNMTETVEACKRIDLGNGSKDDEKACAASIVNAGKKVWAGMLTFSGALNFKQCSI